MTPRPIARQDIISSGTVQVAVRSRLVTQAADHAVVAERVPQPHRDHVDVRGPQQATEPVLGSAPGHGPSGRVELLRAGGELGQPGHVGRGRGGDRDLGAGRAQELLPGAAERPLGGLLPPPASAYISPRRRGLRGDRGRAELRPAGGLGRCPPATAPAPRAARTRPRPARRGRRPRTRARPVPIPSVSAIDAASASDLRPQPHSAAANRQPVTRAACSAASGGFLLAIACRMPRAAQRRPAPRPWPGRPRAAASGDSR